MYNLSAYPSWRHIHQTIEQSCICRGNQADLRDVFSFDHKHITEIKPRGNKSTTQAWGIYPPKHCGPIKANKVQSIG